MGFPCSPGTQYFVVLGPIALSVVYGMLTKQQALKTEPKAHNLSSARELNIPTAPAMAAFALVLLMPGKSTTNLLQLAETFAFLLGALPSPANPSGEREIREVEKRREGKHHQAGIMPRSW